MVKLITTLGKPLLDVDALHTICIITNNWNHRNFGSVAKKKTTHITHCLSVTQRIEESDDINEDNLIELMVKSNEGWTAIVDFMANVMKTKEAEEARRTINADIT